MESASRPTKISRVDLRYRHQAQDVSPEGESVRRREAELERKEAEFPKDDVKEPLLIRELKGRPIMGRAHRMFHRRQAEPSNILTVAVEVIATVDPSGNIIAQETVTQSFPQVPSVPAFPSDLTVPAYPWPSGVPSVITGLSSQSVISSPAPTSAPTPDLSSVPTPIPTTVPASLGFNSTTSSIISSSSFHSTNSTSSLSSSRSSSSRSSSSSTRSSTQTSMSPSSTPAASSTALGGGGGGPLYTAPAPSAAPTAASGTAPSNDGPLDTPKVVGSVIGSLAGAAILLALILFLIKRHKRNQHGGAMQLPDGADSQPIAPSGQQMATRSSFVPAGAAAFLHRFSGASRSTAETSTTGGERGFQRISGRKLPSAFSEGMTSEQFARGEGTLSGSSFYKDESGFYGGPGIAAGKEFGKETGEPSSSGVMGTKERIMPSPARTPVIHHPEDAPPWGTSRNGGSTLSPPHSPNPDVPPRGTLGRSHPSHDGSRSSRFTENV